MSYLDDLVAEARAEAEKDGDPETCLGWELANAVEALRAGPATRLTRYLRTLHGQGYWLDAWYPLANGDFECRITAGAPGTSGKEWGVHADPLEALAIAMRKAELPTEDWDEDTEADNPDDLEAAARAYRGSQAERNAAARQDRL